METIFHLRGFENARILPPAEHSAHSPSHRPKPIGFHRPDRRDGGAS